LSQRLVQGVCPLLLAKTRLAEMEKNGILPKGKGEPLSLFWRGPCLLNQKAYISEISLAGRGRGEIEYLF
jgi:hypothetical protein